MRFLEGLIPLSRRALSAALAHAGKEGTTVFAVDATTGNGHDTLFLASQVGETGRVWAFDVQEAALASARGRFAVEAPELLDRVVFVPTGHETVREVLPPEVADRVRAVTFNLGFLPGSDKQVVTRASTTLRALHDLADMLAVGGILSVHAYRGHEGGQEEDEAVRAWFEGLSWKRWRAAEYRFTNKHRNGEVLYLAERIAAGA